jgi:hypothetical protein
MTRTRINTNFGHYEQEDHAHLPRSRRLLIGAVQLILVAATVVLVGKFVFPMSGHAGSSGVSIQQPAAPAE